MNPEDASKIKVELYVPRKCSATNRIIGAKDHGSVQLNVGHVDANGIYTGEFTTFAFAGNIRLMGESDSALNRLAAEKGLMKNINKFPSANKFSDDS